MPSKVFQDSILSRQFLFATVILLTSIGCRQSEPIPAEIVGDSMAPLLCGAHLSQRCPNCDFAFVCRTGNDLKTVQCSNCGAQFAQQGQTIPADRVQVTPDPTPQRWDVIAFEHNDSTMIKRVVGLPGETVSITGGNVLIDQYVAVKPDAISTQTKHLVFDSDQHDRAKSSTPLQYEFNADHWNSEDGTVLHPKRRDAHIGYDWINYRHQRNYPHFTKKADETTKTDWPAIQDNNSFNQNVGRKLNDVHELAFQLDLKVQCGSKFKIQSKQPHRAYFVTLEVDPNSPRYVLTFSDGNPVATAEGTFESSSDGLYEVSLLFSNIDRRIEVAIDGEVLVDEADGFDSQAINPKANVPRLKFGFSDTSWGSVTRCQIWRDIHYFALAGPPEFELPLALGNDEYFVLGDNVAVSRDSRHFGPIKKVIGVVDE